MIFIDWIKACITSPRFSVVINGELKSFFAGEKGLRQGDPLSLYFFFFFFFFFFCRSPYLFALLMEVLSLIISFEIQPQDFKFRLRCEKLRFTHLCFADDILLFCRGNVPSVKVLKVGIGQILGHLCTQSQ